MTHRLRSRPPRKALSLVELVVVLVILVILTTVSLQATEGLVEQGRFDASRRSLEQIEAAIVGRPELGGDDALPRLAGFVADMGRLPRRLEELFDGSGLTAFSVQSPAANVLLGSGWRGPYLRLPIGATELKDPYNQDFLLSDPSGSSAPADIQVNGIAEVSIDPAARVAPFDATLSVTLANGTINRFQSSVVVSLEVLDLGLGTPSYRPPTGSESFQVTLFEPDGNGAVKISAETFDAANTSRSFPLVTIGARVLRAERTDGGGSQSGALSIAVHPTGPNTVTLRAQ